MAYHHSDALHRHTKRARKARVVAVVISIFVALATLFVFVDWMLGRLSNNDTVVSSEINSTVQAASIDVYRTEYFQFQAPSDWILAANQSNDKKFVYLKQSDNSPQRIIVYVDRVPANRESDHQITNVIPVEYGELGSFTKIGEVSDHCQNGRPEGLKGDPYRGEYKSVSFVCTPDSRQYNVIVGEYDKDEAIEVSLKDGRQITLTILYSDLSAYPGNGDLMNILSSFRTL